MYTALGIVATIIVVLIVLYLLNRFVWFFRDPKRAPDATGDVLISPADGQVVYIKPFTDGAVYSEKLGHRINLPEIADFPEVARRSGWIIGMYMSPFDVHFNYVPAPGTVKSVRYTKADANLPMVDLSEYIRIAFLRRPFDNFAARFHLVNERNTVLVEGKDFSYAVVEIADKYVNKIDCFVKEGEEVSTGDKVGFIKRGSQVDLIVFSDDVCWDAYFGQQVHGGKTVLAHW
jgi:phosphatidylserine decarboxylase